MLYVMFGEDNRVNFAANDETISVLPQGAYSVTQEQWDDRFNLLLVDGEVTYSPLGPVVPTPAEVLASQSLKLQALTVEYNAQKNALTNRIATIQDAIDLEMATPEEEAEHPVRVSQLKAWKTYGVLLGRVTTQVGWPPDVVWPVKPSAGMDLSVSASAPQTA